MRDNPLHVQAFGADPDGREAGLRRMFEPVLRLHVSKGTILGALSSGTLIGVCSMVRPGRCQLTTFEKMRLLPPLLAANGLPSTIRLLNWASCWAKHDWEGAHWHLGPVGIDRHVQGKGFGSALLREFCARVDADHAVGYLETDKQQNVGFYEHFGFRIISEDHVLGVPNWFMVRDIQNRAV